MIRSAKTAKPDEGLTLDQVPTGGKVQIVRIDAGHGLKNRLTAMGFLVNEVIEVIRNDCRGQVIVAVKNSKVVLGRGMSHKIYIK